MSRHKKRKGSSAAARIRGCPDVVATMWLLLASALAGVLGYPPWGAAPVPPEPVQVMTDVTNQLGVAILQDFSRLPGNVAFSPYGVASVLIVLWEGARGDSGVQLRKSLGLPCTTHPSIDYGVVRLGMRDIHRHLRSYFAHDGYLNGLTFGNTSASDIKPSFRQILRFYGYDPDTAMSGGGGVAAGVDMVTPPWMKHMTTTTPNTGGTLMTNPTELPSTMTTGKGSTLPTSNTTPVPMATTTQKPAKTTKSLKLTTTTMKATTRDTANNTSRAPPNGSSPGTTAAMSTGIAEQNYSGTTTLKDFKESSMVTLREMAEDAGSTRVTRRMPEGSETTAHAMDSEATAEDSAVSMATATQKTTENPLSITEMPTTESIASSDYKASTNPTELEAVEPSNTKPETTKPTYTEAETTKPTYTKTETTKPSYTKVETTKPTYTEAEKTTSTYTEVETIKSTYTETETIKPTYTKAETTKPTYTTAETTKPTYTEAEITTSTYTEVETTKSTYTETETIKPTYTEAATSELTYAEAETSKPSYTDAATTESSYTEADTTKPFYTESTISERDYENTTASSTNSGMLSSLLNSLGKPTDSGVTTTFFLMTMTTSSKLEADRKPPQPQIPNTNDKVVLLQSTSAPSKEYSSTPPLESPTEGESYERKTTAEEAISSTYATTQETVLDDLDKGTTEKRSREDLATQTDEVEMSTTGYTSTAFFSDEVVQGPITELPTEVTLVTTPTLPTTTENEEVPVSTQSTLSEEELYDEFTSIPLSGSTSASEDDLPKSRKRRMDKEAENNFLPEIQLHLHGNAMLSADDKDMDSIWQNYQGKFGLPLGPFLVQNYNQEPTVKWVPMIRMVKRLPFAYSTRLQAKALMLPLDDERYKLLLVLPSGGNEDIDNNGGSGWRPSVARNRRSYPFQHNDEQQQRMPRQNPLLMTLIRDLGSVPLREIIASAQPCVVAASIPPFLIRGLLELTPSLIRMGVRDVFDSKTSDLSGMTNSTNLWVRGVEQTVSVAIDVTGIFGGGSRYREEEYGASRGQNERNFEERRKRGYTNDGPHDQRAPSADGGGHFGSHREYYERDVQGTFVADSPFVFFVVDTSTKVALMAGKVVDPTSTKNYS